MTDKIWIPEMPDSELDALAERIKAVYRFDGHLCYIAPVDIRTISFTWSPKPSAEKVKGLVPLCDITTYHTFAYHGFFKPTIGEVLRQIPKDLLDTVVAFEIIDSPKTTDDFDKDRPAFKAGYHVATTRLYGKETA